MQQAGSSQCGNTCSVLSPARRFEACVFMALLLLLVGVAPTRFMQDPGTFWHTRIGLDFLETGQLPQADTFTYTMPGKAWISQYWLCEIIMAGLYKLGGWDALIVTTATVLAGFYAWLAARLFAAGLSGVAVILATVVCIAASTPQFHVRPVIATIILLGTSCVLLTDVEAGRRPLRELWWLVPLFLLWTNLHGGVLGGLASLGFVSAGWIAWRRLGFDSPVRTRAEGIELAAIAVTCGLTVVLNPYGARLPRFWIEILQLPLSELIVEHAPLWKNLSTAIMPIALAVLYFVTLFSTPRKQWRVTWLLPVIWFLLACQRCRHASLFAVVVLAVLPDLLPHTPISRFLAWRGPYHPSAAGVANTNGHAGWLRLSTVGGIIGVAVLLQSNGIAAPLVGSGCGSLDPTHWPVQLLPQLKEIENAASSQAVRTRIFNEDLYGGFLIFHTPWLPVYVDDRCELFGAAFLRNCIAMCHEDTTRFDREDERFHFTHALVRRGTAIDQHLRSSISWTLIGETKGAALYGKSDQAGQLR